MAPLTLNRKAAHIMRGSSPYSMGALQKKTKTPTTNTAVSMTAASTQCQNRTCGLNETTPRAFTFRPFSLWIGKAIDGFIQSMKLF